MASFFPHIFHELCPKWNKSSILRARLMKPSVDVLREEKNGNWKKKRPNLQTTYDIFIAVYDSPP